jgi:hypothetical protein
MRTGSEVLAGAESSVSRLIVGAPALPATISV